MINITCNRVPGHVFEMKKILEKIGKVDYVDWNHDEMVKNIERYHILIPCLSVVVDKKVLDAAKNLRIIATPSTGTDHIDLKEAEKKGIIVFLLKEDYEFLKNITSTAELALGLMICVVRRIHSAFDAVKKGIWDSASFRGNMLAGKTLGIIGFGRLGEMMACYGNSLRMKILATDPYKKISVDYVKQVSLEQLLRNSDIISIHVHLNEETREMIGKKEFQMMKKGAILINTSRGAIIDEKSMLEALKSGILGGAGLDVLSDELYTDISKSPIVRYARKHQNVVITPHIGGVTFEAQKLAYARIASKVEEWLTRRRNVNEILEKRN